MGGTGEKGVMGTDWISSLSRPSLVVPEPHEADATSTMGTP
jgi:hypothetical protein